jgi:hypothetical protein
MRMRCSACGAWRSRLLGPFARFPVRSAVRGDAGKTCERRALMRVEREGALVTAFGLREGAEREQRVAAARVRIGEGRIQFEQRIELFERLGRALELQQDETERIARTHIGGSDAHGLLEQAKRLVHASRLLKFECRDVIEERMFKAVRKRRCRKLAGVRMVATLRRGVHGAHGGTVGFEVACHELSSAARFYFDHMRCRF